MYVLHDIMIEINYLLKRMINERYYKKKKKKYDFMILKCKQNFTSNTGLIYSHFVVP